MKTNQKGFSVVEVLAVTLIVALIGTIGWLFYNNMAGDNNEQPKAQTKEQDSTKSEKKTFDCNEIFSLQYSSPLQASKTTSDPPQCLVSNVKIEEMPPVGPSPPEQLSLFFNTDKTEQTTSKDYLDGDAGQSSIGEDYAVTLKDQEELTLDNGKTATLATMYGGHPVPHDYYLFVYIKEGRAITTDFPVNTDHKELALTVLKSIQ